MAIDMSTDNSSLGTSPRISFSRNLCPIDDKGCRRDSSLLDSSSDEFDFCISNRNIEAAETSSAEELFSNGLIRTVQFQEKLVTSKYVAISKPRARVSLPTLPTNESISKQDRSKETVSGPSTTNQAAEQKNQPKSFWRIKRSSSLHGDNKKSSFWSLPLLSRSNSTGSVPNSKQTVKENHKQNANNCKQQKNSNGISASSSFYVYPLSHKPPLRKSYLGPNSNGIRISPVLNVPHMSKGTANLLGLGSFFRNGKEKKIKK